MTPQQAQAAARARQAAQDKPSSYPPRVAGATKRTITPAAAPPAAAVADRVKVTRNKDGQLEISGLTPSETDLYEILMRGLTPAIEDAISQGLANHNRTVHDTLARWAKDIGAQTHKVAQRAAQEVVHREIIARVKRVERDSKGDILSIIEEPLR